MLLRSFKSRACVCERFVYLILNCVPECCRILNVQSGHADNDENRFANRKYQYTNQKHTKHNLAHFVAPSHGIYEHTRNTVTNLRDIYCSLLTCSMGGGLSLSLAQTTEFVRSIVRDPQHNVRSLTVARRSFCDFMLLFVCVVHAY